MEYAYKQNQATQPAVRIYKTSFIYVAPISSDYFIL